MSHDLLPRHHDELDRRIAVLLTRADGGDPHELANEWSQFERELLQHFELEEREDPPRFSQDNPEEAAALAREHEALRRDLLALGIGADLHFLRADAVRNFIADLRAHAAREDHLLYPWAQAHVDQGTWQTIARRLRDARDAIIELADQGSHSI